MLKLIRMKSINRFFSSVAEVCNPNKGTLSGAMDVIVVQRPDGTMASTPFHIKFGRLKLMKSNKIKVNILVNNAQSPILMELKGSGKAEFFRDISQISSPEKLQQVDPLSFSDEEVEFDQEDEFPVLPESLPEKENSKSDEEFKSNPEILLNESELEVKHSASSEYPKNESISEGIVNPSRSVERLYRTNSIVVPPLNNLSSEELRCLNLIPGLNYVNYVTHTKKRVSLTGKIYLWNSSTKIVVSDIDGTLTKSDLMGHICYMIGKDWSRGGVASLYNNIVMKGYQILYLSSRSLGQIESTRGYLCCVNQEGEKLPDGPVLLSPDSMMRSIVREISKYSQVFKENTLNELLQIYPPESFPFYAGFGNREGDAIAYSRLGIPAQRIFILKSPKKNKKSDYSCIKNFNEVSLNFEETFPNNY